MNDCDLNDWKLSDWDLLLYESSLKHFRKKPSGYTALPVFLYARKSCKEVPEEILEHITPLIERLKS
jgi:hypothetical protein